MIEDYSTGEWVMRTDLGKRFAELTQVMILALKRMPKAEMCNLDKLPSRFGRRG